MARGSRKKNLKLGERGLDGEGEGIPLGRRPRPGHKHGFPCPCG